MKRVGERSEIRVCYGRDLFGLRMGGDNPKLLLEKGVRVTESSVEWSEVCNKTYLNQVAADKLDEATLFIKFISSFIRCEIYLNVGRCHTKELDVHCIKALESMKNHAECLGFGIGSRFI